ncbi:MAG: ABC transporter ATP-binding protein [Candidatus Paceibacterota bacterium]|jgi:ATP-binding cassette subfamily B protein
MNYRLSGSKDARKKESLRRAFKKLSPLLSGEKKSLAIALSATLIWSAAALLDPMIISWTIDSYIKNKDIHGVLISTAILLGVYAITLAASYIQTITLGGVGRRVLFNLRNAIFDKLQELPAAFFNQNKSGDLISRINNDTDKLNQFIGQALMQFMRSSFIVAGSGIFLLSINFRLGAAALIPAIAVLIATSLLSSWVERTNFKSLQAAGGMSSEIQESLANFKVVAAFNRFDYFRDNFKTVNLENFRASIKAGIASSIFAPIYNTASGMAQLMVLGYGIYLINAGDLTVGSLIGYLLYVNTFYGPLRQLAAVWPSMQLAFAAVDRISEVLSLRSDMEIVEDKEGVSGNGPLLEFKKVSFTYPDEGRTVLSKIDIKLQKGKTYALVGPTGGGKTTTASLMARLYDASEGAILLDGKDIRSYPHDVRSRKIGFILQEPFLFTGTIRDNIVYGNEKYMDYTDDQLTTALDEAGLLGLIGRFSEGLETKIAASGDTISLGQKQLVAFIRAVLREPDLLILDEATANIDTVTEQLLEDIIDKLPKKTTKVIIAHRLNTIDNADEIYFVNAGKIVLAGSMDQAVKMLMGQKRTS